MERPQKILLASFAVVVCIAGYFAYDAVNISSEAAEKREDAEQLKGSVSKLYSERVFPSKDNIAMLKKEASFIDSLRVTVTNQLGVLVKTEQKDVSPSQFVDTLRKCIAKWVKNAPVIEGDKCVAPDFAFGFEKYVGGNLPDEGNVARLGQQLLIADALVTELYGAKVTKIDSLVREAFDGTGSEVRASDDEDDQAGGRRNRRNRRGRSQDEDGSMVGASATSVRHRLFTAQHYSVSFKARQNALVDLLNRLAKAKIFAIVTDISIKKGTTSDVRIPFTPQKKELGTASGRRAKDAEAEENTVVAEFSDLPAGSRVMSGPDIDPLLEVVLELDVYNFGEGK